MGMNGFPNSKCDPKMNKNGNKMRNNFRKKTQKEKITSAVNFFIFFLNFTELYSWLVRLAEKNNMAVVTY